MLFSSMLRAFSKLQLIFTYYVFAFFIAEQAEKSPAVHPLQGLFHVLTGDNAAVVLAQDHID